MIDDVEIGKEYYTGYGNSQFGSLALVKVTGVFREGRSPIYNCDTVKMYIALWEFHDGSGIKNCFSKQMFNTLKEAKEAFYRDMEIWEDPDLIRIIFKTYK